MDSEKRLVFFKAKIKSKLEEIKDDITDIRYKLFISLVDTCNSYEELREMAELDMQLDMFEYTRNEINPKLVKLNMGIDELRESKDNSMRTDKSIEKANFEINIKDNGPVETYTAEEMLEDLDDPEIDAAMAAILLNRVLTEPMEETYRTGMLDSLNEVTPSIEDLEDISDEDMEGLGELGDSVALNDDDFDIDESDIEDESDEDESDEDESDEDESDEDESDEDEKSSNLFDDFADINTDVKTQIKDLDNNIFSDDTDGLVADDIESDEDEDDIFDTTDDADLENEIEEDESDDITFDDSGLFADDDDDEESEDGDDISFDDSDLFGDDTDEDDEEDLDIDSLEDADFGDLDDTFDNEEESDKKKEDAFGDLEEDDFGDLDDTFEDGEEENASFDGLESAGDIFDSLDDADLEDEIDDEEETSETKDSLEELEEDDFGDLLSDEDDECDDECDDESDPFDDLDGLDGFTEEEDSIQIEDDEDDFFSKNINKPTSNQEKQTRKIEPKTVFSNGTDRGQKTQDMFTSITKIGSLFGKLGTQATIQTKKAVQTTKAKAATSSFFSLADNEDEIDGF